MSISNAPLMTSADLAKLHEDFEGTNYVGDSEIILEAPPKTLDPSKFKNVKPIKTVQGQETNPYGSGHPTEYSAPEISRR